MKGEIICVGNELLSGNVVNTNARFLSEQLSELGIAVLHETTVADDAKELRSALVTAVGRSAVIILTGGLGPTKDDLTKETVAKTLGMSLVEDSEAMARIEAYYQARGREMPEINRKQALVPEGAQVFYNQHGTAPGIGLTAGDQVIVLLPGPPDELTAMFEESVRPFLCERCDTAIAAHTVCLFGIGESAAAEQIAELFDSENPTVAPYVKAGEVELRVTGYAKTKAEAEALCRPMIERIEEKLGAYIYGVDVQSLQHVLVERLKSRGAKIATAESCTAGLLSKKLTEVPGSSAVFEVGIVAYANTVKTNALGVPAEILESEGAVSAVTAAAMAKGVWEISGASFGVSVTGNAGPDALENKPVGRVYIGLCDGAQVWVERLNLGIGAREKLREMAAKSVLNLALRYADGRLEDGVAVEEIYTHGVFDAVDRAVPPVRLEKSPAPTERVLPKVNLSTNVTAELYSNAVTQATSDTADAAEEMRLDTAEAAADDLPEAMPSQQEAAAAVTAKKLPWYKRLRNFFFPKKGDSVGEVIRKIIFLIALIALIGSAAYITNYFIDSYTAKRNIDDVRKKYAAMADSEVIGSNGIYEKFKPLFDINRDIVGWIKIEGSEIDNPVVQNTTEGNTPEEKNNYYINHDLNKKWSVHGTLFLDSVATFTREAVSQNSVIYGHHMQDGTMFNNLKHYRELDYYKTHPVIEYDTLYRVGDYKIFAVMVTNTQPDHDNNYVFNYRMADFESQTVFMDWISECRYRSIIDTSVDVLANDEILTLSTCVYDFDNARLVVMARRVREGESTEVNVAAAKLNENPRYPQVWYDKRGGTQPKLSTPSHEKFHDKNSIVIVDHDSSSSKSSSKVSSKTSSKVSSKTSSKPTSSNASSQSAASTSSRSNTPSYNTTTSYSGSYTPPSRDESTTPSANEPTTPSRDESSVSTAPPEAPSTQPPEPTVSEDATTSPEESTGGEGGGESGGEAGGEAGGETGEETGGEE